MRRPGEVSAARDGGCGRPAAGCGETVSGDICELASRVMAGKVGAGDEAHTAASCTASEGISPSGGAAAVSTEETAGQGKRQLCDAVSARAAGSDGQESRRSDRPASSAAVGSTDVTAGPGTPQNTRLLDLTRRLSRYPAAVVAFSGGVDSSVLLAAAQRVIPNLLAVTAELSVGCGGDVETARAFCERRGIAHRVIELDPLTLPEVRRNTGERCYFCKKLIFAELIRLADGAAVLDGSNASDAEQYRPGLRALAELGIHSPLKEAGLTKPEVVALARELGLETAERPPSPCMATRFPYGTELSAALIAKADQLERALRGRGILRCRCRIHGDIVRVEVAPADFCKVAGDKKFVALCHELGFSYVTLDLEGIRSGSMDIGVKKGGDKKTATGL